MEFGDARAELHEVAAEVDATRDSATGRYPQNLELRAKLCQAVDAVVQARRKARHELGMMHDGPDGFTDGPEGAPRGDDVVYEYDDEIDVPSRVNELVLSWRSSGETDSLDGIRNRLGPLIAIPPR